MARRRISRSGVAPVPRVLSTIWLRGCSLRGRSLLAVLVVAFVPLLAGCAPEPEGEPMSMRDTSEENLAAISGLVADFMETYNTGDAEGFVALFTEDAIRMPPEAPPIVGIDRIRANTITTFETYDTEVTVNLEEHRFSGDFAITRGTFALRLTPKAGGEVREDVGSFFNLVVRGPNGRWRIDRNMWNSDQPD